MPRRRRSKDRPSLEPSEEPPPDGDAGDAPGAAPAPAEGDGDRELSLDEAFGPEARPAVFLQTSTFASEPEPHNDKRLSPRASSVGTMASQGATLQNYNNELVKCIEDLREKREAVRRRRPTRRRARPSFWRRRSAAAARVPPPPRAPRSDAPPRRR